MTDNFVRDSTSNYHAWSVDQVTKSEFFHQKLHEWGLTEIANKIEMIQGETLSWDLEQLSIAETAWNKIIHRGVKPVIAFAHPEILQTILQAVGYYRMMAMVSQKSMNNLALNVTRYETGNALPDAQKALEIAKHLNKIVSTIIEFDNDINPQEFILWRGMAAGAQADGSWRNLKGKKAEIAIKGIIVRELRAKNLIQTETPSKFTLVDGRTIVFADEPDVAIYRQEKILVAIEVKGGIDTAGILERVGAAIKSLSRAKEENKNSITILLIQGVSMSQRAVDDLLINQNAVNHWFTIEDFLENETRRKQLLKLMML